MKKFYTFVLSLASVFISATAVAQCENYTVQIISAVPFGGPTAIEWQIQDLDYEIVFDEGTANFNAFTFQITETVCLEPGCYNLNLVANGIFSENTSGGTIMLGDIVLYPTNVLEFGTQVLNYNFCTEVEEPTCEACFTATIFENQMSINNCSSPVDTENTTFTWDFGDGTSGDGAMPIHEYAENGTYTVCVVMMVTTDGVITCIDDLCQNVIIGFEDLMCTATITATPGDACGVMNFSLEVFEPETITWYPGDETGAFVGDTYFSHTYAEPGVYNVCAVISTPFCNEGIEECFEIVVEECGGECMSAIGSVNFGCGGYQFYINALDINTNIYWNFGDGSDIAIGGFEIGHSYLEPGEYMVTATWAGPECGEQSETIVIVVEECGGCSEEITVNQIDCDSFIFSVDGVDFGAFSWNFGDGSSENSNLPAADHTYMEDGIYEIHVTYSTENCDQTTLVTWVEVNCDGGNECPNTILTDYYCDANQITFIVDGLTSDAFMSWEYNGEIYNTEHPWLTVEITAGWISICAWSDSLEYEGCEPICQEIFIQDCGDDDCDGTIAVNYNCPDNLVYLYVAGWPENTPVTWYLYETTIETPYNWLTLEANGGWVNVCAWSNDCPEICQEIYIQDCGGDDCELVIDQIGGFECEYLILQAYEMPANAVVHWSQNGELMNEGNVTTFILEPGENQICAWYEFDGCVQEWCETYIGCEDDNCPDAIWFGEGELCGVMQFEIGSFSEGENVQWWFGDSDEQVEGGHFITHLYEEPGEYLVCAFYTSNDCPDGVELCTEIFVEECGEPCDAFLSADMVNCNHWAFNLDAEYYNTNIFWNFDDGNDGTWGGIEINHEFGPGTYEVCASWSSEMCGEQMECITIVVEGCDNDCPDYIIAEQIDCNSFIFQIEGVDGGDVEWHFGDGGSENSGPIADHSYEEGGYYIVTATFSNDNCDEGVTLVYTVWVDCENTNDCPEEIWWGEGDLCGVIQFEIGSFVQGESVVWYPGDESGAQEGGHFWVHTYAEPGVYTVCAWYTSPLCPNGVELCTEIVVESCEGNGDCPDEIWNSENDCGSFSFEIGSFTEGESVDWYVGEYLAEENGGHFWEATFETEGWISVCAFYTSNNCPDGVWICTEVYSDLCGGDCTEVNFSLDSYLNEDGPTWVNWHLFNGEGVFIADGIAQYSNDDPYYDWAECLPDGCYSLYVCAESEFNGGAFDMIFSDGWDVVEITPIFNDECIGYNVLLSLNGDCGQGSEDCEASFEPIFTANAGHVEFENNSTWEGEASFYWSYGNGQSSDDMGGNVWYTENGEYEVCLTITTSEGCTDTYCETIVIDDFNEECEGTEVLLQISTNYPEPGEDNWSITINFNDEELGTFPFISCFECPEYIELPLCLADGCYEIEFNSDYGINAEEILLAVFLIGQEIPIGELSIGYDDETGIFQVGVNNDCEDAVEETFASAFSVYPNPASDMLNISNTSGQTIQLNVFDGTGRLVETQILNAVFSTLNVSRLSNGIYTLQMIGEKGMFIQQMEIAR